MKKYFLVFFTFVCCFFLSSRVFASEFVRLSLSDSYMQFITGSDSSLSWRINSSSTTNKLTLTNNYYYNTNSSYPTIEGFYIELNNSGGFLAHKEYQFSLVLDSNSVSSGSLEIFPYLVYLPNNYSLDTNLLFNSKNVKFCQDSDCTSYFTRDQMNLSYFSMGYSDDTTFNIYTLNFTWVSPYLIDHIEMRLLSNTNLVNESNIPIWRLKSSSNGTVYLNLNKSLLVYDYYDFQGVPNDNVCVGDECINHYDPDDSISSNPNINTNVNINSIISNAWSGLSSFASASIYVISMITTLFNSLPLEVKSLLLFCFSLGVIVILWKVLKI